MDVYPNSDNSQVVSQDYIGSSAAPSSDINYLLPRQVGSGSTRGTQTIGVGNISIDGSNDRITLGATSGGASITLGEVSTVSNQSGVSSTSISPNGSFGFTFNDGTVNRLLIGQNAFGEDVVWVSKPGIEVTNASVTNLIFNSNQDIFKIVKTDTYTDAVSHTTTNPGAGQFAVDYFPIATIAHGLGYLPAIVGFLSTSNGYQPIPFTEYSSFTSSIVLWFTWTISVDATNVNIALNTMSYGSSSGITAGTTFKYYLLQESIN